MMDAPDRFGEAVGRLAADPAFASFAKEGAGILVWNERVERILWASPPAEDLRRALSDESGSLDGRLATRERLCALAGGIAPREGVRLEKLRLDPAHLAPPVTCACRLAALDSGEMILVTAIVGPVPRVTTRRQETERRPGGHPEPRPAAPASVPEWSPRGTVRFVWQADAAGRFTDVSAGLADVVGPMAADIVGRTWDEVARSTAEDRTGAVADLFARAETYSGRPLLWRVDNHPVQVPVEWAGMPIFGRDRALVGFRGFGLIRTDAAVPVGDETIPRIDGPQSVGSDAQPSPGEPDADGLGAAGDPVSSLASEPREAFQDAAAKRNEPDGSTEAAGPDPADPDEDAVSEDGADTGNAEPSPPLGVGADELASESDLAEDEASEPSEPAAPDSEEGWFSGLRGRVAASLAGAKAAARDEPKERTDPTGPRTRPGEAGGLSNVERSAFREIARALGARFDGEARAYPEAAPGPSEPRPPVRPLPPAGGAAMLDRLPAGILVHRGGHVLFANRSLLELAGYDDVAALRESGGFQRLFPGSPTLADSEETGRVLALSTRAAGSLMVDLRSGPVEWDGTPATLVMLQPLPDGDPGERLRRAEVDLRESDQRVHELEAILDTATDGVIVVDETGRILSLNRSAEALFGYDQREVVGDAITVLLAPESHIVALDYLEGLRAPGMASLLNDGRDVMGRVRQGGSIPLFMTMGHVSEGANRKFCAVLRDITAFKKAEGELLAAKRAAEEASAQKSDLLAKISHEIRTPLNAIIGFAEVMLEERFGPVGNERYKDYLKDVHASGAHVISLVNDLLDLAKIEAGRMELAFTSVSLNELVSSCVALLQPQAARERIVMRTSFATKLPPVVADERSMRQIVLNLVSNAIKFTDAGGQVIVSTAVTDRGEVAFRVRDTGIGMTEAEVEAALEPFRQLATARKRGGTGLGLPLTKALVEANRGALQISSHPNEGTLVEVLFPPARVLAG